MILSSNNTEKKLSKLKSTPNYLEQLKARREHCIENLLIGNINLDDNINGDNNHLEEDFETNRRRDLLRYIQPEQPINLSELLAIVNHDYLDNDQSKNSTESEATTTTTAPADYSTEDVNDSKI